MFDKLIPRNYIKGISSDFVYFSSM